MSIKVPQDVADRNALRRLARQVYEAKRAGGMNPSLAWATVNEIASKAVEPLAMDDLARETAERIAAADAKRAADIERSK